MPRRVRDRTPRVRGSSTRPAPTRWSFAWRSRVGSWLRRRPSRGCRASASWATERSSSPAPRTIYPGQALPPLLGRTISEAGIQAIVGAAIDAGLDNDETLGDLGSVGVSDMPTTVFTLSANGETHRVEAYALGMPGDERPEGMSQGTWAARQALSSFVERLGRLPAWLPEGSIGAEAP